jgi:tellurite resistance protein TerC
VTVPLWVWAVSVVVLLAVLMVDLVVVDRRPHLVGLREAAVWVAFYVAAAVAFGIGLGLVAGGRYAGEFFAGWITEYSLSVDNLFVFVLILGGFAVPPVHQHKVLLFGIAAALVLRGLFITAGSAAINTFSATFYAFGLFLLATAVSLLRGRAKRPTQPKDNLVLRAVRRVVPTTEAYVDGRLVVRRDGRRLATPLLVAMVAVATTDVLFAVDSIPAVFGLTREPYLVFTVNAFALMGLRQLYFLIGGLLDRLVYLSTGLAVILGFIGVKLILEAMHDSGLPVPAVPTPLSLGAIALTLTVTTVLSLRKSGRTLVQTGHTASTPRPASSEGVGRAGEPGASALGGCHELHPDRRGAEQQVRGARSARQGVARPDGGQADCRTQHDLPGP